jgi:diketogulonate reductase-like aldo/keto reductase
MVQKGFVYFPKSVKKEHMGQNAQVFDFELSAYEIAELDSLTTPEAIGIFRDCNTGNVSAVIRAGTGRWTGRKWI